MHFEKLYFLQCIFLIDREKEMFKTIFKRVRTAIDTALQGTHNHYTCYLPRNIGPLPAFLLRLFYSGVRITPNQMDVLHNIPDDAVYVYVTKYKSYFEHLFYYSRYNENGAPPPEIGFEYPNVLLQPMNRIFRIMLSNTDYFFQHFKIPNPYDSGYIREELLSGRAGFLSLIEPKEFYRLFVKDKADPLRYLIEMQQSTDRPVYIIPHLIFYSRTPPRSLPSLTDMIFGNKEKPGNLRRLAILFKNPGKVFVEISQPLSVKAFLKRADIQNLSQEKQSLMLRQELLHLMNRHRQSITGPVLKSRDELKWNILTGDRLRGFMGEYAEGRNIPIYKVRGEAEGYLEEIAAKYSPSMIRLYSIAVKWLIASMFEGYTVNTDMLARVKEMARKGPLVLVPCHKSHIDYLILSFVFYHNDMPCPHVAAGKNLSFWPLGPLFRGGGAFFIRRTFKGAKLYARVFAEYVYKLLDEGFNIEFFIEGGRSRTGKIAPTKTRFIEYSPERL
jgi:glycerol-3-phosphate O-acyltransferase